MVTMAGRGQRFRDAGYDLPKYAVEVHGRSLFAWALVSLSSWLTAGAHAVFVSRREDGAAAFVAGQCEQLGVTSFEVVELDGTTDGQATTVLAAEPALGPVDDPLLVYNIDTHVRPGALGPDMVRGDGWLPCFPGPGTAWSFARSDASGRVTEVREKQRISDDATVGLYWFRSMSLYRGLYDRAVQEGRGIQAGERYVAPLYNVLLERGGEVFLERLGASDVVPLGTPAEVASFAAGPAPDWCRRDGGR